MKANTKRIVYIATLVAVVLFLGLTPYVGYIVLIPAVGVAVTLILVPVIVGAVDFGLIEGFIAGLTFGLTSLINAYIRPSSFISYIFQNPLVSVVPRPFVGITPYYAYKLFTHLFKNSSSAFVREVLPVNFAASASVITNTALVVGILALFYGGVDNGDGYTVMMAVPLMLINFALEITVCNLVCPPVCNALKKALTRQ